MGVDRVLKESQKNTWEKNWQTAFYSSRHHCYNKKCSRERKRRKQSCSLFILALKNGGKRVFLFIFFSFNFYILHKSTESTAYAKICKWFICKFYMAWDQAKIFLPCVVGPVTRFFFVHSWLNWIGVHFILITPAQWFILHTHIVCVCMCSFHFFGPFTM